MILLKPSYKIETPIDGENAVRMLKLIESAARTCYKSECKITDDSYKTFVRKIANVYKHESVIEHSSVTVRFIFDRGVSHELVRHRLCAFSQESTRYVDYSEDGATKGNCQFIIPTWCPNIPEGIWNWDDTKFKLVDITRKEFDTNSVPANEWLFAMQTVENQYNALSKQGWTPQQARTVLPNSTKTEIVVTTNFREWRHIFKLRTSSKAHPQIREVMIPLLNEFKQHLPELFDNIVVE